MLLVNKLRILWLLHTGFTGFVHPVHCIVQVVTRARSPLRVRIENFDFQVQKAGHEFKNFAPNFRT